VCISTSTLQKNERITEQTRIFLVLHAVFGRAMKIIKAINFLSLILGVEPQLLWCDWNL